MEKMKSWLLVFVVISWPSSDAWCMAFSNCQTKLIQTRYHDRGSLRGAVSPWPTQYQKTSLLSPLRLSKLTENAVEEKPIIIENGRVESNSDINNVNGITNNASEPQSNLEENVDGRALGILVLLTVPLAWGTYTPVVKYMYEKMDPSMPGFVFSAGYYLVAAASLRILSNMQDGSKGDAVEGNDQSETIAISNKEVLGDEEDDASITTRGGLELGSYLFIGNGLQVVGLQTVPADRAAFLVQLTTVLVPLISALSVGKLSAVPIQTWIACIIAFTGVIIMGADDGGSSTISIGNGSEQAGASFFDLLDVNHFASSLQISQGDFLIVLAAVAYTMHVVRLGVYAPRTTPLKLATAKATTEACFSVLLVMGLAFIGISDFSLPEFVSQTGSEVSVYLKTITSSIMDGGLASNPNESSLGVSIGAILWTGWVTCAYTIYAQSFGQSRVNPTDANLIYTTQPLFSSMFAYVLLGETLGFYGFVGAIFIGSALWLVSNSYDDES